MIIKTIAQPNKTQMIVIGYTDDNGNATQIIQPYTDENMGIITNFIAGKITQAELIQQFSENESFVEDVAKTVNRKLEKLSEHLSCDGVHVYFDNDRFENLQLDTTLEDHIVSLLRDNADETEWKGWVNFTERLYTNVHADIRERLFAWLKSQGWLTVDEQGRLIGYRGCAIGPDNIPVAKHQGYAIVDGKPLDGEIPNAIGSIIEMPRSMVEHNPNNGCSTGLHVGTLNYAKSWAGHGAYLLRVAVAPEDIVSVPFECDSQKIRCCRFEVLSAEHTNDVNDDNYKNCHTFMSFITSNLFDNFNDFDDDVDDDEFDEEDENFPW